MGLGVVSLFVCFLVGGSFGICCLFVSCLFVFSFNFFLLFYFLSLRSKEVRTGAKFYYLKDVISQLGSNSVTT